MVTDSIQNGVKVLKKCREEEWNKSDGDSPIKQELNKKNSVVSMVCYAAKLFNQTNKVWSKGHDFGAFIRKKHSKNLLVLYEIPKYHFIYGEFVVAGLIRCALRQEIDFRNYWSVSFLCSTIALISMNSHDCGYGSDRVRVLLTCFANSPPKNIFTRCVLLLIYVESWENFGLCREMCCLATVWEVLIQQLRSRISGSNVAYGSPILREYMANVDFCRGIYCTNRMAAINLMFGTNQIDITSCVRMSNKYDLSKKYVIIILVCDSFVLQTRFNVVVICGYFHPFYLF